ncbi:MAG: RnfABCDGE type electron transport complex subunit D [Planctomycetes bacterium]|nr:RnfABCDGE type electron transport complex subunit D [Planctomycetota bacterium]
MADTETAPTAERTFIVGSSPHVRAPEDIPRIMWTVVAALLPAAFVSAGVFGYRALIVILVCAAVAVATEALIQRLRRVPVTIGDGSAVVAGVLLAFCLPATVPLYVAALGSIFAIAIAKHAFGGLGMNIWNPALAARAFLLSSFSTAIVMPKWAILQGKPFFGSIVDLEGLGGAAPFDAIAQATPLELLKTAPDTFGTLYSIPDLIFGLIPGSLGETSALALLAGGGYLIARRIIDWRMPASFIGTVAILVAILPHPLGEGAGAGHSGWFAGLSIVTAHSLSGGLFLGAFFMATDMVTSPITGRGQLIFGAGCGVLTAVIRLFGGFPEGVCYAILIMNTLVPAIDRWTRPRKFGAPAGRRS